MKRLGLKLSSGIGRALSHKIKQTQRLSRKTAAVVLLLMGAALVSLVSLGFARLADYALHLNREWSRQYPLAAFAVLPAAMMLIVWFTRRYAPYTAGSGIPQVLAMLSMPKVKGGNRLVVLGRTVWKIPLTFFGMLAGASIGREGPSVQVGAAVMLAWGSWCKRYNLAFKRLQDKELLAAGAAGGLAAAFNAPLAGVIFAIEELGRSVSLHWERQIFIGVLASGFFLVAIEGNSTYFHGFHAGQPAEHMLRWALLCAVVCGVAGGLFARFLSKGATWLALPQWRNWMRRHPIWLAGVFGLMLAALGVLFDGQTYGTGYQTVAAALHGIPPEPAGTGLAKLAATVATYWTGIAGGIFTPALSTGAGIGSALWLLSDGSVAQGLIALLCTAAFLAAATQSPVTASVVVMEMTGSQSLLFWMLVSSIAASVIARQFCPQPFYHFAAGRFRQRVREELLREGEERQAETAAK